MPHFSIIVPSHGVAGRLPLALDSVLAQSAGEFGSGGFEGCGDFELIVVCDGPEAPAAELAAEHAESDPRVRAVHSTPAAGLGGARNTGLAAARGTYVLFLDGDDTLAPGALAALSARLAETGEVDVLYTEHERLPWWEGAPKKSTLPPSPKGSFAPAKAPALTGAGLPAWSAVYRRSFLTQHHIAFPEGHFTDFGFGGLVTLHASRVAALRRPVVRHLMRRQGNRLNLPGPHHLQLLDQIELVLAEEMEHRLPPERLGPLFGQLFTAALKTAADPARLPGWRRRAFFRRAGRLYRRFRPANYGRPGGSLGLQHLLLATGAYTAFRAFWALRTLPRAKFRSPRGARWWTARHYRRALRRPLDCGLAVYCADQGDGRTRDPAAIHTKAAQLAPHIRSVFLVRHGREHTVPAGAGHAVLGTPQAWEALGRAKYVVHDTDFAGNVVKRPGSVHVQAQRGTPLKRTGLDRATRPVAAAGVGSFVKLAARVDSWDYSLSANTHSTRTWERAFPGGYEQLEYGHPRNDVLYTADAEEVARIRRELGVPEGTTAVLYAPARREHQPALDLRELYAAAGDRTVILLRTHHPCSPEVPSVIDVTAHPSTAELCLAADVLVTDYGSIVFDYANLDRPIVVYAPDLDVYTDTRGLYFDITASPPGPVACTPGELARIFAERSYAAPESAELRAGFRARFCEFDDGRAAERVVRRVLLGEPAQALPAVTPLTGRTPAPRPRS